jgi:hypothetical protein
LNGASSERAAGAMVQKLKNLLFVLRRSDIKGISIA